MAGLNYAVSGTPDLPAVLFLHGFMGSGADWKSVIATLEGRFRCVAVDLPGHGASVGLSPESYIFENAARLVLDMLDELEIDKMTFVGYSMGGRLALYLVLRYPERCSGLFLESASPGLRSERERAERRAADEEKASRLESEDFDKFLHDWYRQPLFESLAQDAALLRGTIESRRRNDPAELAKSLRGMGTGGQPSLWGELAGLRVPVFTVVGELDRKFVEIAHRIASLNPRVQIAIVPGAGHSVHVEVSKDFLELLGDFLVPS